MHKSTGVDLSKILGGANQNIGEGQKVVIIDESIDVSQLLGAYARVATLKSRPVHKICPKLMENPLSKTP